jgi:hypothetical protein
MNPASAFQDPNRGRLNGPSQNATERVPPPPKKSNIPRPLSGRGVFEKTER